jgi:hypothetical protein
MPAETHSQSDPVGVAQVLDLIWALTAGPELPAEPTASTPLAALGLQDEHARLWIWEIAVEEFAERTLADPDPAWLYDATTVGELASGIASSVRRGP